MSSLSPLDALLLIVGSVCSAVSVWHVLIIREELDKVRRQLDRQDGGN